MLLCLLQGTDSHVLPHCRGTEDADATTMTAYTRDGPAEKVLGDAKNLRDQRVRGRKRSKLKVRANTALCDDTDGDNALRRDAKGVAGSG